MPAMPQHVNTSMVKYNFLRVFHGQHWVNPIWPVGAAGDQCYNSEDQTMKEISCAKDLHLGNVQRETLETEPGKHGNS